MNDRKDDRKQAIQRWKYDPQLIGTYEMVLEYVIPVYVNVDDGEYPVNLGRRKGIVHTTRIKMNTPERRFLQVNEESNIRVVGLRNDFFYRTKVATIFTPTGKEMDLRENFEKWKIDPITEGIYDPMLEISLRFVNRFLLVYQMLTGETAIDQIRPWEIGYFRGHLHRQDVKKHLKIYPGGLGGGGRVVAIASEEKRKQIQTKLLKELSKNKQRSLHEKLISDANHLYLRGLYSSSIVVAQSALEVYVRNRLREVNYQRIRLPKRKTRAIDKVGLSFLMKIALPQAFNIHIENLNPKLWKMVEKSSTRRNNIVHKGKEEDMDGAASSIKAFSDMLSFLESTFPTPI